MKFSPATRRKWLLWLAGLWLAGGWAVAAESPEGVSEYQVKAAFIYNFTKFTDWPTNAFTSADAPLVIGIVGEDPFGKTMDDVVRGEVVRDRPLVVKRLRPGEDFRSCHVLFISRSEKDHLRELLGQLKGRPVLAVGDTSGFAEQGGTVNFVLVQKTVKMEINQAAAAAAGLQISAKLLKLARLVKS
jgi:hypothetical protein